MEVGNFIIPFLAQTSDLLLGDAWGWYSYGFFTAMGLGATVFIVRFIRSAGRMVQRGND